MNEEVLEDISNALVTIAEVLRAQEERNLERIREEEKQREENENRCYKCKNGVIKAIIWSSDDQEEKVISYLCVTCRGTGVRPETGETDLYIQKAGPQ